MKKYLLLFLFIGFSWLLFAQNKEVYFKVPLDAIADLPEWIQRMYSADPNVFEVDFLYYQYFREHVFTKTIHTQNYKYWRRLVAPWVNAEGLIRKPSYSEEDAYFQELKKRKSAQNAQRSPNTGWKNIGPVETYQDNSLTPISFHANVYCLDQSDQNPDLLYAGTEAGGVFKSMDKGQSWTLVSKGESFVRGIQDVKISPMNTDFVLVGANDRVYRTENGGVAWEEVFLVGDVPRQFRFHPDDDGIIFLVANNGLYKSEDEGDSWTQILSGRCWDIQFHPTNPDVMYFLRSNLTLVRNEFYKSTDGGATWELKDQGWYIPATPGEASDLGGKIGVTPASPDMIYVGLIGESKSGDMGWIGVYRSTDTGESWVNPSGQDGGPYSTDYSPASYGGGYHQGWFNFDLEVSDIDPAVIWTGTIRLSESADSAKTFIPIGAANSQRLSLIHADIQDLEVNGNEIWVASDGGINYSTDELYSHESRKTGIFASDYWGFGSGWNEDVLVGGLYHNGNSTYLQDYGEGNFKRAGGVEEATGYVHPIENRKAFFSEGWVGLTAIREIPSSLDGTVISHPGIPILPNESYVESTSSGLYFDPRYADHLYAGSESQIWKSTNGGASFSMLHDFGQSGRVFEIEISRSNPEILYCVFQPSGGYWDPCEIHRSADGGNTWEKLPNVPSNRWRLEISLNPGNESELWVAANSGADGEKVFSTIDGGQTWINRTTSMLSGERTKDILFQAGTNQVVYLATNTSVFYWDSSSQDWVDYGQDLPLIINSLEMRPFYRDGKLRLATYGRGIWETELVVPSQTIPQPITYKDTIYCPRDTVLFDCYSVLNHDGAFWEWAFEPTPQYVSGLSSRNPKVVFGEDGSYDVSLTITDGSGEEVTKMIPSMVSVAGKCSPDSIPGLSIDLPGNPSDYVTGEALDLNSNTITISAWIKPDGIQNDFAGVVFWRGGTTTVGLNFRANNELGYHWDDGEWWWSSGAIVPENEWSHVALVIEPNQATIYLNGKPYVNGVNHPAELFETAFTLGADPNWQDRRFDGQMDEVCIWNRALSQDEIRLWRHLTKEEFNDPDSDFYDEGLVVYYQFNALGEEVLDRVNLNHGTLGGNIQKVVSSAPIGGGLSAKMQIEELGVYDFGNTGILLDFSSAGTLPDGELVVSRIHLLPNVLPNSNPNTGTYWILNNYGNNPNFSSVPVMQVTPKGQGPSQEAQSDPEVVEIFTRNQNGFEPAWTLNCNASSANPDHFEFDAGCDWSGSGHQIYLVSADQDKPIIGTLVDSEIKSVDQVFRLFPNPVETAGSFLIQCPNKGRLKWILYDATGKKVEERWLEGPFAQEINAPSTPGIYFYTLRGAKQIANGVLVVD